MKGLELLFSHVTAFLLLRCSDGSTAPLRSECVKESKFENPVHGKSLANHMISSVLVDSQVDCAIECVGHDSCQSFNYQSESSDLHQCELNNASASSSEALNEREQFSYYGPTSPAVCASSPCRYGGTCVRSCDDYEEYECFCPKNFIGRQCETYIEKFDLAFPRQSIADYAVLNVSSSLFTSFTACIWLNTAFASDDPIILFSYAEQAKPHQIRVGCKESMKKCHLMVDRVANFVEVDSLADSQWHQVCVKWNSTDGKWAFYVDGAKRGHGSNFKVGYAFQGRGKLVLGQRQDSYGGNFAEGKSYVGALSQFHMWDGVATDHVIKERSRACAVERGDLISWREFNFDSYHGDVKMIFPSGCRSRVNQSDYLFQYKTSTTANYIQPPTLPTLTKFTACFWSQLIVDSRTVFSYATATYHRALEIYFDSPCKVTISLNNEQKPFGSPWMLDGIWHHLCLTWDSVSGILKQYYDGVQKATHIGWQSGASVEGGGRLRIGQRQTANGTHNDNKIYMGNMTQFNLWSRVLLGEVIDGMSLGPGSEAGDLVAWPSLRDYVQGDVLVEERPNIALTARDNNYQMVIATRSTGNYVKYHGIIPDMTSMTACIWFKTTASTSYSVPLFSYANSLHDNALSMYLESNNDLRLCINNGYKNYLTQNLRIGQWNNICTQWRSTDGEYNCYINGEKKYGVTGFQTGSTVGGGGALILGQDQDSVGGSFEKSQALVGSLSNFDIWKDQFFAAEIMTEMGKGCGTWSGNLVSWRDLRNSPRYGDVVIQEYSECYTPGVVTRSHRDQYCQDLIAAIPSASCSTPAYALFDTRVDLKNVMWRCYFANAVKTVVRDHTFAYDKDLLSACFYTRHGELTMIQD